MTPEQFAYWLQGYAEIHNSAPTAQEWKVITDHLATVFKKVTPSYGPGALPPAIDPIKPYIPYRDVYTTPPNWPRPEIMCSVGAGSFSSAIKIEDLK